VGAASFVLFFLISIFFRGRLVAVPIFLVVIFVFVFGENDEMDWMGLRDLQFGVALGAAQDFAFLDLVFIQVDFGVAFRTSRQEVLLPEDSTTTGYYITPVSSFTPNDKSNIRDRREYPERPIVGVGGVVISNGRTLLIKRAYPPLEGQWSIPGGTLEVGETLLEGVRRELLEEAGIEVRVLDLIEVFERIFHDENGKIQYHFVILDYLCEAISGEPRAGSDVTDVAWATQDELGRYSLTPTATRVIQKAFEMAGKHHDPAV
jgi:8-oxo-dGTP diphosphatase